MNVPAVAKKTYEELKDQEETKSLLTLVLENLRKLTQPFKRAQFVHELVDGLNTEIFEHPLVKQMSPCKEGCTGCCHTQVSVTEDEAILLANHVSGGLEIDVNRLALQAQAGNDTTAYYNLTYAERKCVFLSEEGSCRVYQDRPSVCRTNAVLGEATQCDTSHSVQATRLVRTPKSDLVIYASFLDAHSSGALPKMLGEALGENFFTQASVSQNKQVS